MVMSLNNHQRADCMVVCYIVTEKPDIGDNRGIISHNDTWSLIVGEIVIGKYRYISGRL